QCMVAADYQWKAMAAVSGINSICKLFAAVGDFMQIFHGWLYKFILWLWQSWNDGNLFYAVTVLFSKCRKILTGKFSWSQMGSWIITAIPKWCMNDFYI